MAFSFKDEYPVLGSAASVDTDDFGALKVPDRYIVVGQRVDAATATSGNYFVAPEGLTLIAAYETHDHIGGSGNTLGVYTAASGTAMSSGTALLASNFDLNGVAAATVKQGTLTATVGDRSIPAGNQVGWKMAGTATALVNAVITMVFART